jgi:hypothetical protein
MYRRIHNLKVRDSNSLFLILEFCQGNKTSLSTSAPKDEAQARHIPRFTQTYILVASMDIPQKTTSLL